MLKVTKTSRIQIYINAGSNSFTGQRKDTCNEKLKKTDFRGFSTASLDDIYDFILCDKL